MTYCDAEKAIRDGTYKSLPNEVLREMMLACMSVSGPNQSAILRIHKFGDLIETELTEREKAGNQSQGAADLTSSTDLVPNPISVIEPIKLSQHWDESALTKMIQDKIEESLNLDYKAAGAISRDERKKLEIAKDVSAMANSAGGVIIYGIKEYQRAEKKHMPERLDPINRVEFTKEWIEHIICHIRPRIPGVKIYPVPLSSGTDDVAFVVDIPEGTTAHQASDFRYYRRYNFESVPMADHEVRDVMSRKTHPSVDVEAKLYVYARGTREGHAGALQINIINKSDVLARHVGLILNVPTRIQGKLIHFEGAVFDDVPGGSSYRLSFSNSNAAPLFPRAVLSPMFKFKIVPGMVPEPEKEISDVRFVVFADSMPKQAGTFPMEQILRSHPKRHQIKR